MKKIISVILSVMIVAGIFTSLCGLPVYAAGDVETTLYNPAEITLTSAKEYKNPYTDVDIDAVFVHQDGTTMKTPGFWKEDQTWAVRFTPTKLGTWTYTITATDASNSGLHNVTGTLVCKENDKSTEFEKHGFVEIPENKRYFAYSDGTPFFWLGDTNWQAPNYIQTDACNYPGCYCKNQFKHEVDNRLAKGFNVYQTYFDAAESDGGGQRGKVPSLWSKKGTLPSAKAFNEKVDFMFKYLHDNGMVAAIGFGVHTNTANNMSEADLLRFSRYIVARYSCYSVVWISGQEITDNSPAKATPGKTALDVYMSVSSQVEEIDCYKHPNGAHMYPMVSYDERAKRLDNSEWHDFFALQGGHGKNVQKSSFYQSYFSLSSANIKPYIESEANYEDINCGGFTGYDANRYCAWNGVLNGCAGFTYGVAGIWANCYSNEGNTGWYGLGSYSYEPWYMGLDKPGSYEVSYLKKFFEEIPDWTKLVPRFYDQNYSDFSKETHNIASTDDKKTVVCYFYNAGSTETGIIKNLDAALTYKGYWYNPLTGKYIPTGEANLAGGWYTIPEKPDMGDWTFLLTAEEFTPSAVEGVYQDVVADGGDLGKIVTPKNVTAVGGCYYISGKLVDLTSRLYDLKGNAAWEPLADRVTQTIIYDLGTAYSLTNINIVPATGTILPKYRVEVSNDGATWTIMANSTFRDQKMSADGTYISEPLKGDWRYVKIIILNAPDIPKSELSSVKYLTTYNEKNSDSYYSHTAIAEISVYASKVVETPVDNNGGIDIITPAPDTNNGNTDNGNTDNNGGAVEQVKGMNTGVAVAIIGVGAAVGIAVGVVVAIVITKKKEN